MNATVRKIIIAVAAVVFLFSGFMVLRYVYQTENSEEYTEEIAQMAVSVVENSPPEIMPTETEREDTSNEKIPQNSLAESCEVAPIKVDFDALFEINQEVVAWLYCPDTPINYPIVQASDNAYYLRRRLDRKYDDYGTLFMDCRNAMTDWNCIVYGHNMYSEAMFGTLTEYKEQAYFDSHRVMYLITPNQSYKIKIFAGFTTTATADLYQALNPNRTLNLIDQWRNASDFVSEIKPAAEDRILTLSTCSYESDNARYVLMGVLEKIQTP